MLDVPARVSRPRRCGFTGEAICFLKELQVINDDTCRTRKKAFAKTRN